jgi:hypothetical protein
MILLPVPLKSSRHFVGTMLGDSYVEMLPSGKARMQFIHSANASQYYLCLFSVVILGIHFCQSGQIVI